MKFSKGDIVRFVNETRHGSVGVGLILSAPDVDLCSMPSLILGNGQIIISTSQNLSEDPPTEIIDLPKVYWVKTKKIQPLYEYKASVIRKINK